MSKKNPMNATVKTVGDADALMNSASVVVAAVDAPVKTPPPANVVADVKKLNDELKTRGGVKMVVREGTVAVPTNPNQTDPTVNNGGNDRFELKINTVKKA